MNLAVPGRVEIVQSIQILQVLIFLSGLQACGMCFPARFFQLKGRRVLMVIDACHIQ